MVISLATAVKSIRHEESPAGGIHSLIGVRLPWQAVLQVQSRGFVHSAARVHSTLSRWVAVQPKGVSTDSSATWSRRSEEVTFLLKLMSSLVIFMILQNSISSVRIMHDQCLKSAA